VASDGSDREDSHEALDEELEAVQRVFERTTDEFQAAAEDEDLSVLGGFVVARKRAETFESVADKQVPGGDVYDE